MCLRVSNSDKYRCCDEVETVFDKHSTAKRNLHNDNVDDDGNNCNIIGIGSINDDNSAQVLAAVIETKFDATFTADIKLSLLADLLQLLPTAVTRKQCQ